MKNKFNCVLLIDDDEPTNCYNSFIIEQTGCTEHVEIMDGGQKALDYLISREYASRNDGR